MKTTKRSNSQRHLQLLLDNIETHTSKDPNLHENTNRYNADSPIYPERNFHRFSTSRDTCTQAEQERTSQVDCTHRRERSMGSSPDLPRVNSGKGQTFKEFQLPLSMNPSDAGVKRWPGVTKPGKKVKGPHSVLQKTSQMMFESEKFSHHHSKRTFNKTCEQANLSTALTSRADTIQTGRSTMNTQTGLHTRKFSGPSTGNHHRESRILSPLLPDISIDKELYGTTSQRSVVSTTVASETLKHSFNSGLRSPKASELGNRASSMKKELISTFSRYGKGLNREKGTKMSEVSERSPSPNEKFNGGSKTASGKFSCPKCRYNANRCKSCRDKLKGKVSMTNHTKSILQRRFYMSPTPHLLDKALKTTTNDHPKFEIRGDISTITNALTRSGNSEESQVHETRLRALAEDHNNLHRFCQHHHNCGFAERVHKYEIRKFNESAKTLEKKCEKIQVNVSDSIEEAIYHSVQNAKRKEWHRIMNDKHEPLDSPKIRRAMHGLNTGMFSSWTLAQTVEQKTHHDFRDYRPFEIRARLSQKAQSHRNLDQSTKTAKQLAKIPEIDLSTRKVTDRYQFREDMLPEDSSGSISRRRNLERINSESMLLSLQMSSEGGVSDREEGSSGKPKAGEFRSASELATPKSGSFLHASRKEEKLSTKATKNSIEELEMSSMDEKSAANASRSFSKSPTREVIVLQEKSANPDIGYQTVNVIYPREKLHVASDGSKSRLHSLLKDD